MENKIVLDRFKPRNYQVPLINAIEQRGFKRAMAIWPRRCLSGNTRILMCRTRMYYKKLKKIQCGDPVVSWNGVNFEKDVVLNVWRTRVKPTIKIKTTSKSDIVTSYDHFFCIYKDKNCEWIKASKINISDRLLIRDDSGAVSLVLVRDVQKSNPQILYDITTKKNHNFIANDYIVHNSGKDLVAWNIMIRAALRKPGSYIYCLPVFSQCRRVLLSSKLNDGSSFMDFIPKELIRAFNQQEMKITLINGSILVMVGSNSYDRIIGSNALGIIISEAAVADPLGISYLRPIVTANDGWMLLVSTPRGHNHLWELYNVAKNSPKWFLSHLTVDDTRHISKEAIEDDINDGVLSKNLVMQEYYTSFDYGAEGAFYVKYIDHMRREEHIGDIPWNPDIPVHTIWDIGVSDTTVILFAQISGDMIKIIDFYENDSEGLEHYINVLRSKPYSYGKHIAPHDMRQREFSTGMSRLDKARSLGISFIIAPNIPIMDGIEAVRTILPRTWIHERKASNLIKALENYTKEFDSIRKVFRDKPLHNQWSHACDAFRYLAVSIKQLKPGMTQEDIDRDYQEAVYGENQNTPLIFR